MEQLRAVLIGFGIDAEVAAALTPAEMFDLYLGMTSGKTD